MLIKHTSKGAMGQSYVPVVNWLLSLFALLARNSRHAGQFFELPPDQVVEIGVQVDL